MVGVLGNVWLDLERAAARALESFGARFGPGRHTPTHLRTGLRGEDEALFFLRKHGYTIVARRWRCTEQPGDLDLAAWDQDILCFIEVKTRTARDSSPAESAIDREKEHALRGMASAYLRRMPRDQRDQTAIRFDVVSVYLLPGKVECDLLRDAFDMHPRKHRGWR